MGDFRDKLVEAQNVLREHMQDFVQMQFSVELNMSVQHDQTAGPVFVWEPAVDLILQTQDSVVTGVEHLNSHARQFLVNFFSSMTNSIMSAGLADAESVSPWKGMEIEGTIFNGQYGWEGSEFIDYQITTRPGSRTLVGVMVVRDNDITLEHCIEKACRLCDYVLVFVQKPTVDVSRLVIEAKQKFGEKVIIRGILSKSATDTYLYPLCRTDTLIVPISTDSFWSDSCIAETGNIMRQMNITGYRGVDIQDCVLDVTEIKSHPPNATGVVTDQKIIYMGNVLKWGSEASIGSLTKNTCIYRDNVEAFARINVSTPGIIRIPHINLSSTASVSSKPTKSRIEDMIMHSENVSIDASNYIPRKTIARLLRGAARWSIQHT